MAPETATEPTVTVVETDLAAEGYEQMRTRIEGDFPAWAELPEATQALYRNAAQHVLDGGDPRTLYERILTGAEPAPEATE